MRRWLLAVLLLLPSVGFSQITVPDAVSPYEPIVAGCNCTTPEGSEVKIRWTISDNAHVIVVGDSAHIWAKPGRHKITAAVVWMQFTEIEVPTANGGTQKIKSLVAWDLQTYEKTFTVAGINPPDDDDEDEDDDDPDPPKPTPTGFKAKILSGLELIGNPTSRNKVAKVYSDVAEEANTRRDVFKPAIMVDKAKTDVSTALSINELRTWQPFWPVLSEAMKSRKMEDSDTDAHIEAFRELSQILKE